MASPTPAYPPAAPLDENWPSTALLIGCLVMTGLFLCAGPAVSCCRRLRAGNSIATVLSSLPKAVLELKRRTWSARKIISGSMRKSDPVRLQRSDVAWAERSLRALRQNEDKLVSMLAERRVAQHRWAESVLAAVDASFAAGRLQTIRPHVGARASAWTARRSWCCAWRCRGFDARGSC